MSPTGQLFFPDKFPSKISGDWGKVDFGHSKYQPFNATRHDMFDDEAFDEPGK